MNIGVDTHKKAHVLVAVGAQGQALGTRTVANTPEGWAAALQWAREQQQQQVRWGVENSGSLGKGFAQFLLAQGEAEVREGLCQNSDVAQIHLFSFPTRTAIFEQCGPSALRFARIIGIGPHFSPH